MHVVWDLDSGYCPNGHLLEECHVQYHDVILDRYQNYCKINRAEGARRMRALKREVRDPEYRCKICNTPLFAGYHILGAVCK